ncbi:MAG: hypothetical protein ABJT31_08430 [Hyphomicrobiales bacterium]
MKPTEFKDAGLSTLEMLVSLSLMALIAILVAQSIDHLRRSTDRAFLLSDATQMRVNHETLRHAIDAMPVRFGTETAQDYLSGDAQSMTFKTILNNGVFWAGQPVQASFVSSQSKDGVLALLVKMSGISLEDQSPVLIEYIIASNVTKHSISYFGSQTPTASSSWHSDWQSTVRLPLLVKIEWEEIRGKPFPPLTLRPGWKEMQNERHRSSF